MRFAGARDRPPTARQLDTVLARPALVAATGQDAVELNMAARSAAPEEDGERRLLWRTPPSRGISDARRARRAQRGRPAARRGACASALLRDARTLRHGANAREMPHRPDTLAAGGARRRSSRTGTDRAVKERGHSRHLEGNVHAHVAALEATRADGAASGACSGPKQFTAHAVAAGATSRPCCCDAAAATSATPRQVHAHLVGKLR